MADREPKHFSMIRNFHLADLFTLGNGFCGIAAIFEAVRFARDGNPTRVYAAGVLVLGAFFLDFFDGRIARQRHSSTAMGREMDSLADVISFGVAPAVIAFATGLSSLVDQLLLSYFVVCGLSRLARYNVTAEQLAGQDGKVAYFEGTPIPTSVLPLGLLLLAFRNESLFPVDVFGFRMHLASLLFAVSGSLMISKTLHIPKP
jgi:CDP-diacylglycerol--serine O-phosphatidyltransferase